MKESVRLILDTGNVLLYFSFQFQGQLALFVTHHCYFAIPYLSVLSLMLARFRESRNTFLNPSDR